MVMEDISIFWKCFILDTPSFIQSMDILSPNIKIGGNRLKLSFSIENLLGIFLNMINIKKKEYLNLENKNVIGKTLQHQKIGISF